MIERIDSPDGVLAFRAVGEIGKADYEQVLEPAVEAMVGERGEVRIVYVLSDEFEGYSVAAGWEDTKLGIAHRSAWKRCAIVTDHDWVRHGIGMFRWMFPGEIKVFEPNALGDALAWAAA
ncbi:MAG: STAS/SEC14 domain-containing protein [Actinobacteria bacterium]|nr:STAS/SEC14 domain-containing protein [Actinomycetota bacterium]